MADKDPLVDTWRQITGGDGTSWVLFKNGTRVTVAAGDDLSAQALAVLSEFGPVHPGTAAADFGTVPLKTVPGWLVTSHHPDIQTYVSPDETDQPDDDTVTLTVGLIGRSKRDQDARDLTVIHIEDKRS